MRFKFKVLSAAATGALLISSFAPAAFAADSLTVAGSGSASTNTVEVDHTNTTTVVQNNSATVTNDVRTDQNTGNNSASDNTGGNVTVDTGNATSTVDLRTKANMNVANVSGSDANNGGSSSVAVTGNGSFSRNDVALNNGGSNAVYQTNDANIRNTVDTRQNTGGNTSDRNTGGDVTTVTGHASSGVAVSNAANANEATIGSGADSGMGTATVDVSGNGSRSSSSVALDNNHSSTVVQDNTARFVNDVRNHQTTGDNSASDNTGGDTVVDTGNARSMTGVDNMANFNMADLGNDGMSGVTARVFGNGSFSDNNVAADFGGNSQVFQGGDTGNSANFRNDVYNNGSTGYNAMDRNTGTASDLFGLGFNPDTMFTGHSVSDTMVRNMSNANFFGNSSGLSLPGLGGVSFSFDLGGLMNSLHF